MLWCHQWTVRTPTCPLRRTTSARHSTPPPPRDTRRSATCCSRYHSLEPQLNLICYASFPVWSGDVPPKRNSLSPVDEAFRKGYLLVHFYSGQAAWCWFKNLTDNFLLYSLLLPTEFVLPNAHLQFIASSNVLTNTSKQIGFVTKWNVESPRFERAWHDYRLVSKVWFVRCHFNLVFGFGFCVVGRFDSGYRCLYWSSFMRIINQSKMFLPFWT